MREKDSVTGVETTGHEWDGIKELNNPLPRWWLWTFYVCIIWSIGYWVLMPAWPVVSDFTKGMLGYSQRATVASEIAAAKERQGVYLERILQTSLEEIRTDPELLEFAMAGGRSAFAVNCVQCHGSGAAGSKGFPNLNDDDWLWGGTLEDIHTTIQYGIRSGHDEEKTNMMPAFLEDEILDRAQVGDVAEYVLSLSGAGDDAEAAARGAPIFAEQCTACHGPEGKGQPEMGAPNLADGIWLYGGTKEEVMKTISNSRAGVMPTWADRLDEATIRQLAVYVHSLGGGQ